MMGLERWFRAFPAKNAHTMLGLELFQNIKAYPSLTAYTRRALSREFDPADRALPNPPLAAGEPHVLFLHRAAALHYRGANA